MIEANTKKCLCVIASTIGPILLTTIVFFLLTLILPPPYGEFGDMPKYQTRFNDEVNPETVALADSPLHVPPIISNDEVNPETVALADAPLHVPPIISNDEVNPETVALADAPLHVPPIIFDNTMEAVTMIPKSITVNVTTLSTETSMATVTVKQRLINSVMQSPEVTNLTIGLDDTPEVVTDPLVPAVENEDNVTTSKMNSSRHQAEYIIQTTGSSVSDEVISTPVSPSQSVTSPVSPKLFTLPDFVFPKSKRPNRPVLAVEKVSGQYSYDFFTENVNFATSVEICRQINQGSRILSIESSQEKRIVDAYVKAYELEIFGNKEDYLRYVWTGGYFDLDSDKPYALRWVDHPTPMEAFGYQQFCPESKDVHSIIDKALSELKVQTLGLTNLNSKNRRWAHVIIDFTGDRISRSCWQIYWRYVLPPDVLELPFICKR